MCQIPQTPTLLFFFFPAVEVAVAPCAQGGRRKGVSEGGKWSIMLAGVGWGGFAEPFSPPTGEFGEEINIFWQKKKAKNYFFFFFFLLVLLLMEKESSALEIYEISMKTRSLPLLGFTKTSSIHLCCNIPLPTLGQ